MQKITPFLWFDNMAEEAAKFYTFVFSNAPGADSNNSKITQTTRYDEASAKASGRPVGSAMIVEFQLDSQSFTALNGGPMFKFTEAVSFVIHCKAQEEIDYFWEKLIEGGDEKAQQCGWLKDKYGLSWQVIPNNLGELIGGGDPEKAGKAMQAMLKMKKIDINILQQARS